MANPLANQGTSVEAATSVPVLNYPPELGQEIILLGSVRGAKSWDAKMREWVNQTNETLSKAFQAQKNAAQ